MACLQSHMEYLFNSLRMVLADEANKMPFNTADITIFHLSFKNHKSQHQACSLFQTVFHGNNINLLPESSMQGF